MKQRAYPFLDFIKAVSIALVAFCHYVEIPGNSFWGNILMVLTSAAVPCFFMSTGYVMLFKEPDLKKILKRIANTYIHVAVWKVLYLLFFSRFYELSYSKSDLFSYIFLFGSLPDIMTGHMWFMNAYLMCLMMLPLLAPLFREGKTGTILWGMALVYASQQMFHSGNFLLQRLSFLLGRNQLVIDNAASIFPYGGAITWCLLFLMLGGYLRICHEKQTAGWLDRPLTGPILLLASLAVLMCVKYILIESWLWSEAYLPDGYSWTSTIFMSLGLFLLLRKLGDAPWTRWLGKNIGEHTMGIFYFHIPLLEVFFQIRTQVIELPYALWIHTAKTVAVLMVCAMLTQLLKKIPVVRSLVQ